MPAHKKSQEAKDLIRRRYEVRKNRKACRKYLGPMGMYIFREFLNLHGRLPIGTTACWAEALARVFGNEGSAMHVRESGTGTLADYRGQFGGWSQALSHRSLDLPAAKGLCFALRLIKMQGLSPSPWKCLALIMYERRSGVLFHYLIRVGDSYPSPNGETIWRAIDQAILRLTTGRWPVIRAEDLISAPVTVAFPVKGKGEWTHPLFTEAVRWNRAESLPSFNLITWEVTTFKGLRNIRLSAEPYSFLELDKMLRQEARNTSDEFKKLMPRIAGKVEGRERPLKPAWLLLFPKEQPYQYGRRD